MVVCDPCFKGKPAPERQLAVRRIHVHMINQQGQEGFSKNTIDLCEDHYQQVAADLGIVTKEDNS